MPIFTAIPKSQEPRSSHEPCHGFIPPNQKLFYHTIASSAEFERELIMERVNHGLARARAQGKKLGRREKAPSANSDFLVATTQEHLSPLETLFNLAE